MSNNFLLSLCIFLIFLSTIKTLIAPQSNSNSSFDYSTFNWMSKIPNEKSILLINIPGTHDTAAHIMNPLAEDVARTQNLTILELLNSGIRKLDIRIDLFNEGEASDSDLHTCHGIFDCYYLDEKNNMKNLTYKHILLDIKKFLSENPSEMVILCTKSEKGNSFNNYKRAVEILDKYVGDILVKYNKNLKLGEVRGKIVTTLYKVYDDNNDIKFHTGIDGGTGIDEIHKKFIMKNYYNTWGVSGEVKVQEVQEFLRLYNIGIRQIEKIWENYFNKLPFSYSISCTGEHVSILPLPKRQANIVNKFILEYEFVKGNYYGWINMDFANEKLARKFIDTNFIE